MNTRHHGQSWVAITVLVGSLLPISLCCVGCGSEQSATTRPTMDAKAGDALQNPMGYSPFHDRPGMTSGSDHLVHTTLQQDVNDVFINP